eukprot:gene14550-biopygen20110
MKSMVPEGHSFGRIIRAPGARARGGSHRGSGNGEPNCQFTQNGVAGAASPARRPAPPPLAGLAAAAAWLQATTGTLEPGRRRRTPEEDPRETGTGTGPALHERLLTSAGETALPGIPGILGGPAPPPRGTLT